MIQETLFVVFIGANDIFFDNATTPAMLVSSIDYIIQNLKARGAEHFLLVDLPNLGRMPYANYISSDVNVTQTSFSTALRTAMKALQKHEHAAYLSLYDLFGELQDHPSKYGYKAVDKQCLVGGYGEAPRSLCAHPDQYVWWDEFHVSHYHVVLTHQTEMAIRHCSVAYAENTQANGIRRCCCTVG